MKIVVLRGEDCGDRITCPHVFATDRGTHIVQGYVSAGLVCGPGQVVVEVPLGLMPEVAAHSHDDLALTARGSVLIRGVRVSDPQALAAIPVAAGEDLVELAGNVLPPLEVSC